MHWSCELTPATSATGPPAPLQFFLMDREAGGAAEPLLLRMTRDHPVEVGPGTLGFVCVFCGGRGSFFRVELLCLCLLSMSLYALFEGVPLCASVPGGAACLEFYGGAARAGGGRFFAGPCLARAAGQAGCSRHCRRRCSC